MIKLLLVVLVLALLYPWAIAIAQPQLNLNPFAQLGQQQPIALPPHTAPSQQSLPRSNFSFAYLQPVPLKGVHINGLNEKALEYLGFNYFVVVDDTPYNTITELYRDNRLRGKGNLVTADSIVHPYLAFTNRVLIEVINQRLAPQLSALLRAMLHVCVNDYRLAADPGVCSDIEKNIAYLTVGIKLMEPGFLVQPIGRVPEMVAKDLAAIEKGGFGSSAILDEAEDFSAYRPLGWYASSPELAGFFRCREWVSRMAYRLSDITIGASQGSSFRRSVLLFRSLDLARVGDQPAYAVWSRLQRQWSLLGVPVATVQEQSLSPENYKAVLKDTAQDMKVTLSTLAEPLFRTKLMLSMRKQKPVGLGTTSIFDIDSAHTNSEIVATFRLFPLTGDPEMPWMRAAARVFQEGEPESAPWPLALADLHAWGAGEANNVLTDFGGKVDTKMFQAIPDLDKCTMSKTTTGQWQPLNDRRWQILSDYFNFPPESAQSIFRTETWMTRRLESAFAGWVDSHLSVSPPLDSPPPPPSLTSSNPEPANRRSRQPVWHYLEPVPDVFQSISQDAEKLKQTLAGFDFLPGKIKERLDDFSRLGQRLQKVAESELKSLPLTVADEQLLSHIDLVLEKVDVPLAGNLALDASGPSDKTPKGVNFGLGRPGLLYMILRQGDRSLLARGAVYTYFETPGAPISRQHWQRKVEFALLKPPYWADKFDILQPEATVKKASTQLPAAQAPPDQEKIPDIGGNPSATAKPSSTGGHRHSPDGPMVEPTLPNEPGLPWYNPMQQMDN